MGLPYTYTILLQLGSAFLHWAVSQSLFVISFAVFDYAGKPVMIDNRGDELRMGGAGGMGINSGGVLMDSFGDPIPAKDQSNEYFRMGYNCLGIMVTLGIGGFLVLVGWADDLRLWRSHSHAHASAHPPDHPPMMPLVGTCSVAISAACHVKRRDEERREMVLKPLRWGLVGIKDGKSSYYGFSKDDDDAVITRRGVEEVTFAENHKTWRQVNGTNIPKGGAWKPWKEMLGLEHEVAGELHLGQGFDEYGYR